MKTKKVITKKKYHEEELQYIFNDQKYYDSQQCGYDTCGTYEFCKCCDKDEKFPCAKASLLFAEQQNDIK